MLLLPSFLTLAPIELWETSIWPGRVIRRFVICIADRHRKATGLVLLDDRRQVSHGVARIDVLILLVYALHHLLLCTVPPPRLS